MKGALSDEQLFSIEKAGIIINDLGIIEEVGVFEQLKSKVESQNVFYIDENLVALPGLVDAHTHICFAGSRANDFAMRNAGSSYLEIAKAGGGIWDTVQKTRSANIDDLVSGILQRCDSLLQTGVTTAEVKSGYGLNINDEIKMLKAIKKANSITPIDLIPTCLAAHIKPKDFNGSHSEYLYEIALSLFPILKREGLTNRIDAFIEEEAFEGKIILDYFEKAKELGFDITVHADQFSPGGSKIAVECNALSADHLEASTQKEIDLLAKSNVVSMALPGASLGLGCDFTPARKLLDAGACLAIASDWNPGSAPMGNLVCQASILATFEKLSNAEVLSGMTYRAAKALALKDRGIIAKGYLADIAAFEVTNYKEILYNQGQLKPSFVWKSGHLTYGKNQ